jgi:hypothetical protein
MVSQLYEIVCAARAPPPVASPDKQTVRYKINCTKRKLLAIM